MAGTLGAIGDGLLPPPLSLSLPTGGMMPGEDGTLSGMDGTPDGAGIPHGESDLLDGASETGATMPGIDQSSQQLEQELLFHNLSNQRTHLCFLAQSDD